MKMKTPIAIVSMAGIFPGATEIGQFWQNILNKINTTTTIPPHRWIAPPENMLGTRRQADKACSQTAGLINDFEFDASGFEIDAALLKELDPLYHIVLSAGRDALATCRLTPALKRRCGAIIAAIALPTDGASTITRELMGNLFENELRNDFALSEKPLNIGAFHQSRRLSAKVTALPGSILSRGLGLKGGSYTLDAACASSLYAVKLACDQLQSKRADVMLAGGVSRPDCLFTQVGFTQLQALSPSGICAPFDRNADGLVVGEGCGILVLKRIEDAIAAQDTILGVIRGIGLSNDIGGNLIAPDTEGQLRAMHKAYSQSGWSPHSVDLIECHGAGTPVGDIIETNSLCRLWGNDGWTEAQCAIGSVKSNIGHLLTAAAAAGLIKLVLSVKHKIIPPSLNFSCPSEKSHLPQSPFRVQTEAAEWQPVNDGTPRRAAINAFGFGGINAHMLVEAFESSKGHTFAVPGEPSRPASHALSVQNLTGIAIVGMAAAFGRLHRLRDFQECVLNGTSIMEERPPQRWRGAQRTATEHFPETLRYGGFMKEIATYIGEFQIPPNEIPDLLPQHLIMLKVAANALSDAGLGVSQGNSGNPLTNMGVTIGMGFDFDATDFHLRWFQYNLLQELKILTGQGLASPEIAAWIESLKNACAQPLTSARTVGALGGIIASRIAKQFKFGGPSFVVSAEEASGLKALEIGVRSLQQGETDTFLVGAVDLPGDLRHMIVNHAFNPYSPETSTTAFDLEANGSLPGEGACALVLKPYDRALADGNRIYAVIKGCGGAGGEGFLFDKSQSCDSIATGLETVYRASLTAAFNDAAISKASISFIECHGSGTPLQDRSEINALSAFFDGHQSPVALGSVKPNIGNTGAAAGLASLAKTALALYQEILPPLTNFRKPMGVLRDKTQFHIPHFPQFWFRDRIDGPRHALVAAMTADGNCAHVILAGVEASSYSDANVKRQIASERVKPLGPLPAGLFLFNGSAADEILASLDVFKAFIAQQDTSRTAMETIAVQWYRFHHPKQPIFLTMIVSRLSEIESWLPIAREAVNQQKTVHITGPSGIVYTPEHSPDTQGDLAFVFPGSGNHYVGMGRGIGVVWPEIPRAMDLETERLKTQMLPDCYTPWRRDWSAGWEQDAHNKLISDPIFMIFGQVCHGGVMANLMKAFSIRPSAVIGYSLGETAGYFAMNVWPERGHMLKRMQDSDLFTTRLAGPCHTARKVWGIPENEPVDWCVAVVDRPAAAVKKVLEAFEYAELLIVNTPGECVIGGRKSHIIAAIRQLACNSFFLNGVVTVHCKAMHPDREAYRDLHLFPVQQPQGIRFYSCGFGKAIEVTRDRTADSIIQNAMHGFDFPVTINQAYKDGVHLFLEMGPYSSCSRMIHQILADRPHMALSVCNRGEDDFLTVLKGIGTLITAKVPIDLSSLFGEKAIPRNYGDKGVTVQADLADRKIILNAGRDEIILPKVPAVLLEKSRPAEPVIRPVETSIQSPAQQVSAETTEPFQRKTENVIISKTVTDTHHPLSNPMANLMESYTQGVAKVSETHRQFLDFADDLSKAYADTFSFQTRLLEKAIKDKNITVDTVLPESEALPQAPNDRPAPIWDRDMCMEFAIGSVANVLGPEFAVVDTYKVRVRLPDEPLMLVDRIVAIEGEKNSLSNGRLVTEHDVLPGAWYLDGNRAPTCISIEAGQADLFLSAYLGIDLAVKGTRAYRLLDAVATFHRGLPRPGDVIRYDIQIEKFIRQGATYLFFFNFIGYIGKEKLITMKNGCAGFFTSEEVKNSGGIILTDADKQPVPGKIDPSFKPLVAMEVSAYDERAVDALRAGDLEKAFGPIFKGVFLSEGIRLPDGRMKLIDRIKQLEPHGGRYGLGRIVGEADIHPDDWFLTCHFVDDMVMPGTLMYQCCEHTLRVFTQRMGWVSEKAGICYEPMIGVESRLKCRGPVTPETQMVTYEVEISAIGYNPEPYVIADAHMYADGQEIVMFHDMCMKLSNITQPELEAYWQRVRNAQDPTVSPLPAPLLRKKAYQGAEVVFDQQSLLAFALGKPSEAFGTKYQPFDSGRFIARLPNPPYLFMDRVVSVEPVQWELRADGWIEAEVDISPSAWYFKANRIPCLPFSVLLEIALQPCGWLAAYMGSALKSDKPLKFRNLGGKATLYEDITPRETTLTMRARLTRASEAGDMIIENFDFQVLEQQKVIYEGDTNFGFFTLESLEQQVGIRGAAESAYQPDNVETSHSRSFVVPHQPPFTPAEAETFVFDFNDKVQAQLPGKALRMVDDIDIYIKDGGPQKLGFIRGSKTVEPDEWFFKAHFFGDPVCPGSLGIESFIQLLKVIAREHFDDLMETHGFAHLAEVSHQWAYRGQIVPQNKKIEIEAVVTELRRSPRPLIVADGYLKVDGLYIYKMEHFGIQLIPNG